MFMITQFKLFEEIDSDDLLHNGRKHEIYTSIQTVIDGKRDVGFICLDSESKKIVKENGLKMLRTKSTTFIIYRNEKESEEKAKKLFDIAMSHKGYLNDQTPKEAREIGKLLGYTEKSINKYIKRKYFPYDDNTI